MARRPRESTTARTTAKKAGKPVTGGRGRTAAAAPPRRPSPEDLDLRDRLKSGPRRQAGPPLGGDSPERPAMASLRGETVPDPTDPKGR